MRTMRIIVTILAILCLAVLSGCGFYDKDKHERTRAVDESVYEAGNPVPAVGFAESQAITLAVKDKDGAFSPVENGRYLPRGTYTFGVSVTPLTVDGAVLDQVVQISDGGWVEEGYVEAEWNSDLKLYVADFKVGGFLSSPILIQVIYPDGRASKAKFVVNTAENLAAPYGNLVNRGLSVTLSKAFLKSLPPAIKPLLVKQGINLDIKDLAPAANGTGKQTKGVIRADLGFVSADIILNDTYTPTLGQPTRGLAVGIEDVAGGTTGNQVLDAINGALFGLFKDLKIDGIPVMALGFELGDMVGGLMSQPGSPIGGMLPAGMELALQLDSTLFVNLLGYPAETTADFAVLGGALYVPDNADIVKDKDGKLLWPIVNIDPYETGIADGMGTIESTDPTKPTDIGVAISQYNLNQMLQGLMQALQVKIKDINKTVALFAPKDKSDNVDLIVTINPKGMFIDFAAQTIVVNDVKLLLVETGPVIAGPVTELSLDLVMRYRAAIEQGLKLNLSIEADQDLSHMHVMKDEVGLTALDHGKFIPIIFQFLSGGQDALSISLPLADMGLLPKENVTTDGIIQADDNGNCFMGMAVGGLDGEKLSSGGCFINTAVQ